MMASEMTGFDIKKGWYSKIEGDQLEQIMKDVFGSVTKEDDVLVSSFGAMKRIEAKVISKTQLGLMTVNVDDLKTLSDEGILESKRKLNDFLLKATGFTSKDRLKRAKDKAKKGKL
ncbi:MAG: DUF5611 family protein [Candidatus Methanomethylophilus sp.]|nr:DUF5611 family protein [Methanomethylophilus sp.]MDD3232727.1 DUF5611 family protein [Methanomethylophilus sp.]MDD4221740.1 DUF5611 family protein [Methanomethylophilus sp.]MDD4668412.1 DUF5611 family protein [Methanomethylophilus sp.]